MVSSQFPARSATYSVDWANGEAHGSKKRRGHGYRPDACIKKHGRQIAFLEVKPPGDSYTAREYLWDYWNLANYTKDAIDLFLQEGYPIMKAAAVQLFRHQLCLYTMEYAHGLYHWSRICTAYVPRDQSDSSMAGCVRLFRTLEINTNVLPRTPPRIEYDDEELQEDRGRPSKVTPSKRKNMF
ncbi:MAG: hypothetical protein JOS17DRAFT_496159 [Linnemannia elongata]|nr:MAG: hypothetical protein JOS17DRAFT_496159 [Linnemannia elongata]